MGTAIYARASVTSTHVDGGSELLRFEGPLTGTAFSLEGARLVFGGVATLGLSSPLRVERAKSVDPDARQLRPYLGPTS